MPKKKYKSKSKRPLNKPRAKHNSNSLVVILNAVKNLPKRSFVSLRMTSSKFFKLSTRTKLLFISGAILLGISLLWNLNQTIQLAFFTPRVTPITKTQAIPTKLIIQKIGINLPIEETAINKGVWQVSPNISHLTTSARPGEQGPIIMYGHNTTERLGPIRWLSKGDKIAVNTADNKIYTYTIEQTMTVSPNKMDIFTQKRGEALILYTCDGFADLQRFVIIASVVK